MANSLSTRRLALKNLLNVSALLNLKVILIVFALINLKCMPFTWTIRAWSMLIRRKIDPARKKNLSPRCLWLPAISVARSPALECDFNLHKSNSTYFTDMDIYRSNFCCLLFMKYYNPFPGRDNFNVVLGATACNWRREIKPYQRYEVWSKILSWDEKWFYVVTHFVVADKFQPREYIFQARNKVVKTKEVDPKDRLKYVLATSVNRVVFKNNRRTIPPQEGFRMCGLLPDNEDKLAEIERMRLRALPIARMENGWDEAHATFEPGESALAYYANGF